MLPLLYDGFIKTANGKEINLYNIDGRRHVKLSQLAKALDYNSYNAQNSLLAQAVRIAKAKAVVVGISGASSYLVAVETVRDILRIFYKLATLTNRPKPSTDTAAMYAQMLLEQMER